MSVSPLITRRKRATIRTTFSFNFLTHATKREKLIFSSLFLTTAVLLAAFTKTPLLWFFLCLLAVFGSIVLILYSLWEDLDEIRYFLIPLLPALFTLAVVLDLHAIPIHPVLLFILIGAYGITMYLILLVANILTISATKTIPLIRAARAASFFFTLVCVFLMLFFLGSLKISSFYLGLGSLLLTALPVYYLLWTFSLKIQETNGIYALIVAFIIGQVAFALGFWPISPLFLALFLTTVYYVCVGLLHQDVQNQLTSRILLEYSAVLSFAFLLLFITTQWA